MKKSEIYRTAIAAVIGSDNLDMEDKIAVLQVLFSDLETAELLERPRRSEVDKVAEELLVGTAKTIRKHPDTEEH